MSGFQSNTQTKTDTFNNSDLNKTKKEKSKSSNDMWKKIGLAAAAVAAVATTAVILKKTGTYDKIKEIFESCY